MTLMNSIIIRVKYCQKKVQKYAAKCPICFVDNNGKRINFKSKHGCGFWVLQGICN